MIAARESTLCPHGLAAAGRKLGLGLPYRRVGRVNPKSRAIARGYPLRIPGVRMVVAAALDLIRQGNRWAQATMSIGVGLGIGIVLELV